MEDDEGERKLLWLETERRDEEEFVRAAATGMTMPDFLRPQRENFGAFLSTSSTSGCWDCAASGLGSATRASPQSPEGLIGDRGVFSEADFRWSVASKGGELGGKRRPKPIPIPGKLRYCEDAHSPASVAPRGFVGLSLSSTGEGCNQELEEDGGLSSPPGPMTRVDLRIGGLEGPASSSST